MHKAYRLFLYPILLLKVPRGSLYQTTPGDIKQGRGSCRGDYTTPPVIEWVFIRLHLRNVVPGALPRSHTQPHGKD